MNCGHIPELLQCRDAVGGVEVAGGDGGAGGERGADVRGHRKPKLNSLLRQHTCGEGKKKEGRGGGGVCVGASSAGGVG